MMEDGSTIWAPATKADTRLRCGLVLGGGALQTWFDGLARGGGEAARVRMLSW